MALVTLTINNKKVQVEEGKTILQAAKVANIKIPTLCHFRLHNNIENKPAACRVCVVEVEGRRNLAPACDTTVAEGMIVYTNSVRAVKARRTMVELLLSNHPYDCLVCEKNTNCELQQLAADMGIRRVPYTGERVKVKRDTSSHSIVRDLNKCILCRRCEAACDRMQTVSVLSALNRGFRSVVAPAFGAPMMETNCVFCGQCVAVCPTGALIDVDNTSKVWNFLNDKGKYVIIQTAPAIRAALAEEFGLERGKAVTGKMVAALRAMGFDKVFDTQFGADLTIMEEATEFINRINNGGRLPILTSCCPSWVKFFEYEFPDLLDIPSTCKSPQQMFGAIAKTYYAEKMNIDPKNLIVVSLMPCLAKKYEANRSEMNNDVDIVISTREFIKMVKEAGIDFASLEDEDFDSILGESTGAAVMFGVSGGVMEAALRTSYEWITGETLENLEFQEIRGLEGVKEATIKIKDMEVKAAVTSGLGNARFILEKIRAGEADYHIIEIMSCPGGCINGGGQPLTFIRENHEILENRMNAMYDEDRNKKIRKSHENPEIIKLYEEFLGKPNSELAHKLLHTSYKKREV